MGEGKERREGREGERKEEIKVERKGKEKGQGKGKGNMLPLSCCPTNPSPVAEPNSKGSLPPESHGPPPWPL